MAASNTVRIELLNKENYDTWKIQMEAILIKNDAWAYVSGEKAKPAIIAGNVESENAAKAWEREDLKAKSDIILSIRPSELKQIKGCNTSTEVWTKLKSIYQSTGPARKATLLKRLTLHKMEDGADVRDHLRYFFDTIDKLNEMDVDINPDLLTVMLLYSLPSSFENFRCAIESRDALPAPEALRIKIIEEYDARNNETRESVPNAMFVNKQSGKRWNKFQKNEKDSKEKSNIESKYYDKRKPGTFKFKCHRCRKIGHKAVDCTESTKEVDSAHTTGDVSLRAGAEYSFVTEALGVGDTRRGEKWCLDSGCTAHMGNDDADFKNIIDSNTGKVKLASEMATTPILGKGSVSIVAEVDGRPVNVNVHEVLRVPELRTGLLSVGKIADKNHVVIFDKEKAEIIDRDGNTVLTADRQNGLYYLREKSVDCSANAESDGGTCNKDVTEVWHRKMGHLNIKDLVECDRNGSVRGMTLGKSREHSDCEICLRGKMTKKPFPNKSQKNSELLEIIHSDVCGPIRVESNGKARYMVTFIDDFSRWCEIRLLKQKSEVFDVFKEFKVFAENQTGRKIKFLQTDNGREYRNEAFDSYLKANGIGRRLTVTHTPQQNGVAERRNRTLMDMTRCLLFQSSLPLPFWGEAINTANYVRNRCPSRSLGGKTPYEKWTGRAPDVSHFEEFGCQVFTLNRDPAKGKLESRSKKGIFVGYSGESKAYRIWLPDEKRIDIARDVKFVGMPKTLTNIDDYDVISVEEENGSPEREVVFPLGTTEDHDFQEYNENHEDVNREDHEDLDHDPPRRGRGRPRIVRTGLRGRPRKEYHDANHVDDLEETVCLAEIPLEQAIRGPCAEEWYQAIASEMKSIIKNDTWTLIERPVSKKTIGSRVVLRNKYKQDGTLDRRKARIVARGFAQRPGIDFYETFAPVARLSSVRTMMALAAENEMIVNQFDVTTAYLNGVLEEEVLMEVPKYTTEALRKIIITESSKSDVGKKAKRMLYDLEKGNKVCRLNKALYGLRQAGRCWNIKLDEKLIEFGAKKSSADPCVYYRGIGDNMLLISVYVDDLLVASRNQHVIAEFKEFMSKMFEIRDLGPVRYCLGMEFVQKEGAITMCQSGYIRDVLDRFGMSESKAIATPLELGIKLERNNEELSPEEKLLPYRELIGALMYLAVCTRPDIAYSVSYLSQFNSCYGTCHWMAAKRVLRYLQGTRNIGLKFSKTGKPLEGFVDADWANCPDDRKSYTGYAFILGSCPISWEARKQKTVALSSTEAEYMALSEATREALWLRRFLAELNLEEITGIKIHCDNHGARKLAENPVFHNRTKHIDVRHHFVRKVLEEGKITIEYTPTEKMAADILTKGMPGPRHKECLKLLGVTHVDVTAANDT